jgi:hypothetical protein
VHARRLKEKEQEVKQRSKGDLDEKIPGVKDEETWSERKKFEDIAQG